MTGHDIYTTALQLMGEKTDKYYEQSALACVNAILSETFEIENNIRRANGIEKLAEPTELTSLADEVIYSKTLLRAAIPYGVACRLSLSDGDMSRTAWLQNLYNDAAQSCRKVIVTAIEDVYGEGV